MKTKGFVIDVVSWANSERKDDDIDKKEETICKTTEEIKQFITAKYKFISEEEIDKALIYMRAFRHHYYCSDNIILRSEELAPAHQVGKIIRAMKRAKEKL